MSSEHKSCKLCSSQLIVLNRCTFCNEYTRLFCGSCDIMAEKTIHPTCMILDVCKMSVELHLK